MLSPNPHREIVLILLHMLIYCHHLCHYRNVSTIAPSSIHQVLVNLHREFQMKPFIQFTVGKLPIEI